MNLELGIRYRFSGSYELVLDFHQAREVGVDRLSGDWAKCMKLSKESHPSNNCTCCIHLPGNHSPHLGRVIDFFYLNLHLIAAGTADDGAGLIATGGVVGVDSPFGHSSGGESGRVVRWSFFSKHNLPSLNTFENSATLPLPGSVVGVYEECNGTECVFVRLRGHDGGAFLLTSCVCQRSRERSVGERKGQGLDFAGPRTCRLALSEPTFDTRKNERMVGE